MKSTQYLNNHITHKQAALEYAAAGFPVLPLMPDDTDVEQMSCYDPTTDPEQIEAWWNDNPEYQISYDIAYDIVVICLQPNYWFEELDGNRSLDEYCEKYGPLPRTASCVMQDGTRLLFYRVNKPVEAKLDAYPGVSILNSDCSIILPPTTTSSGSYCWEEQSIIDGIADADGNVMRLITSTAEDLGLMAYDPLSYLLDFGIPKGKRYAFLYELFKAMFDRGYCRNSAKEAVHMVSRTYCNPQLREGELPDEILDIVWERFKRKRS